MAFFLQNFGENHGKLWLFFYIISVKNRGNYGIFCTEFRWKTGGIMAFFVQNFGENMRNYGIFSTEFRWKTWEIMAFFLRRGIAMSVVESAVFGRQGMITTIGDAMAFCKSGVWWRRCACEHGTKSTVRVGLIYICSRVMLAPRLELFWMKVEHVCKISQEKKQWPNFGIVESKFRKKKLTWISLPNSIPGLEYGEALQCL